MCKQSKFITIGGGSGSGKTTLARRLAELLSLELSITTTIPIICVDSYYRDLQHLDREQKDCFNFDHPDAFDWDFLERQLKEFAAGSTVVVPHYDYATHSRQPGMPVNPAEIVVIEGIMALHSPLIRELSSFNIFVDAPENIRLDRRRMRDIAERGRTAESVNSWWTDRVEPMYREHCAPSSQFAHFIVSGEDDTTTICQRIISELMQRI